jgi:hypothetical protein
MKWMLLVLVFGATPIETGLFFDSLDDCLKVEETMRNEYARVYNTWHAWAEANLKEAGYPKSDKFMRNRDGIETSGTCIPHAPYAASPKDSGVQGK